MKRLNSVASNVGYQGLFKGTVVYFVTRYNVQKLTCERSTNQYVVTEIGQKPKNRCFLSLEDAELKMLQINIEGMRGYSGGGSQDVGKPSLVGYARYLKELTEKYAEEFI